MTLSIPVRPPPQCHMLSDVHWKKYLTIHSLQYFARGKTTKFIRPILWEMTFFASEP